MKYLPNRFAAKCSLFAAGIIGAIACAQAIAKPVGTTASLELAGTAAGDEGRAANPEAAGLRGPRDRQGSEARYQEGLRLERRGDVRSAVLAYRDAAGGGHGMAQRKLGDIYGTGKGGVDRDYETSLKWYQRTQDQGIAIPNRPFVYSGVRR